MARYLMIWELNTALISTDPVERGQGFALLMGFIKRDIERGLSKDWGSFIGEKSGYSIVEGTEVEIHKMVQQYSPYVNFKTHPVASLDQIDEVIASLIS